ncbi:MAG: hypothetical protein N2662_01000 [Bacteroidales bacterium]|nr:hypothetical protein [Bacteroidales bacterium]
MEVQDLRPDILEVADITYLDKSKRVGLTGILAYQKRREFLKATAKFGVLYAIGPALFEACSEGIFGGEDKTNAPRIVVKKCQLPNWPKVTSEQSEDNEFVITFSEDIDASSIQGSVSFYPDVDFEAYPIYDSEENYYSNIAKGILIHGKGGTMSRIFFTPGKNYSLIIKGTIRSVTGKYLDGNDDGKAGDDFVFEFKVPENYNAYPTFSIHEPYIKTNIGSEDTWVKRFEVYFDDVMDEYSLKNAVSISPSVPFSVTCSSDCGFYSALYMMYIAGPYGVNDPLLLEPGQTYQIKIDGSAKSIHNCPIDGNKDGIGGEDFIYTYVVPENYNNPGCSIYYCSCQSNVCSCEGNFCSCQGDSCTCVGFYCSCQFEGCPLYGIY